MSTVAHRQHDPLARQLEHFVAVIRQGASPLVGVGDGLANLRVVEAISRAMVSAQVESLSLHDAL